MGLPTNRTKGIRREGIMVFIIKITPNSEDLGGFYRAYAEVIEYLAEVADLEDVTQEYFQRMNHPRPQLPIPTTSTTPKDQAEISMDISSHGYSTYERDQQRQIREAKKLTKRQELLKFHQLTAVEAEHISTEKLDEMRDRKLGILADQLEVAHPQQQAKARQIHQQWEKEEMPGRPEGGPHLAAGLKARHDQIMQRNKEARKQQREEE